MVFKTIRDFDKVTINAVVHVNVNEFRQEIIKMIKYIDEPLEKIRTIPEVYQEHRKLVIRNNGEELKWVIESYAQIRILMEVWDVTYEELK